MQPYKTIVSVIAIFFALLTAISGCTGGRDSEAAGVEGSSDGSSKQEMGGDGTTFGGSDNARTLLTASLSDLREAMTHLKRGNDLDKLCPEVCSPEGGGPACSIITASSGAQRADATELIQSAIPSAISILNRSFDELFAGTDAPLFIADERVSALTAYGPSGRIVFYRPEVVASALTSLGLLKLTIGHELFHKLASRFGSPYLKDYQTVLPNFPQADGGRRLATLAGACLSLYSETHRTREIVISYLSRGTDRLVTARFDKASQVLRTETITGVASAAGAVSIKVNGNASRLYFSGSLCPSGGPGSCPMTHAVDAATANGQHYFLTTDGRILDSQRTVVASDPKLTSLAYDGDRWYLLRSDGRVLSTNSLLVPSTYLEVPGLTLTPARRLVTGDGPPPYFQ